MSEVMQKRRKTPEQDRPALEAALTRCGRNDVLVNIAGEWQVRHRSDGRVVDRDWDFDALYRRRTEWSEDIPGFAGLLWRSPLVMGGRVCLKGTRILAVVVADWVADGANALTEWPQASRQQIDAAVAYVRSQRGRHRRA